MKLIFNGGAREVGGSCTLVETEDVRIALDYGIKVDKGLSDDMPKDLDAVVVSHAHLDHSGNVLTLSDRENIIIGSKATRDITIELLQDLLKIHRIKGKPLPYNMHDIYKIADLWSIRERTALPGMEISLIPAGHVLGANMIHLKTNGINLLYTGDFCLHKTGILNGINLETLPKKPDALIMESTYGDTIRPTRIELMKTLFAKMIETMDQEGNILLPVFAFHRLQEMARSIDLAMKEKIIPNYNAYYISGLAHRINRYYNGYKHLLTPEVNNQKNPFIFHQVRYIKRTEHIEEPAIVICTSGFGHAGASNSLLLEWAGNEKDRIIINTGYLPSNSPLQKAKEGKIINNGESIHVNAKIDQIKLSGHADQHELIELVKTLKPKQTFLVHGNLDQAQSLSQKISRYTQVQVPNKHENFKIN